MRTVAGCLAAAGVGRLVIADPDVVEVGNLHRQLLYSSSDVGRPKVEAAADRLRAIYPQLVLETYHEELDTMRAAQLATTADVVMDCTDSFESRYAMNAAALRAGKPLVHGACLGFAGQVMTVVPDNGPCFRCLCPEPPPLDEREGCRQVGILRPVAGIVGSIQAAEAMNLLLGLPGVLVGQLLSIDAQHNDFACLEVPVWGDCPDCGGSG